MEVATKMPKKNKVKVQKLIKFSIGLNKLLKESGLNKSEMVGVLEALKTKIVIETMRNCE